MKEKKWVREQRDVSELCRSVYGVKFALVRRSPKQTVSVTADKRERRNRSRAGPEAGSRREHLRELGEKKDERCLAGKSKPGRDMQNRREKVNSANQRNRDVIHTAEHRKLKKLVSEGEEEQCVWSSRKRT